MSHIIVAGALANKPFNGGEAWVRLSWVLGFAKLGFDVHFVEQIRESTCINSQGEPCAIEQSIQLQFFRQIARSFQFSATLVSEDRAMSWGALSFEDLQQAVSQSALLVNISGNLNRSDLLSLARRKAYIDVDPGYTQIWHTRGQLGALINEHQVHFTVGQNIGSPRCALPTDDIRWHPILPPVVLDHWPVAKESPRRGFSSVGRWRGPFGSLEWAGKTLGMKCHEFRKVVSLPQQCEHGFELAYDIHPADKRDRQLLEQNGWSVVDPQEVAADPISYQHYLQTSAAEFSVANGVYLHTQSGWFSDRTAHYLASGRPVLVQDTGLPNSLRENESGLLVFQNLDEAVHGADRVMKDYSKHQRAARRFAETYLDSDRLLTQFLERADFAS